MHFLLERIDTYVSLAVALGYVERIFLSLEYDDIGKHTAHLSVTIHFSYFDVLPLVSRTKDFMGEVRIWRKFSFHRIRTREIESMYPASADLRGERI